MSDLFSVRMGGEPPPLPRDSDAQLEPRLQVIYDALCELPDPAKGKHTNWVEITGYADAEDAHQARGSAWNLARSKRLRERGDWTIQTRTRKTQDADGYSVWLRKVWEAYSDWK